MSTPKKSKMVMPPGIVATSWEMAGGAESPVGIDVSAPVYERARKAAATNAKLTDEERDAKREAGTEKILKKAEAQAKFRQHGERGIAGGFDQDIAYYLEAIHAGKIKWPAMPEFSGDPTNYPTDADFLSFRFLRAVAENNPSAIRRITEAVERVHARATGEGKSFKLADAKPGLARLVKECRKVGESPPKERESIPTTKDQTVTSGLSETVVKEVRRAFGVPPDKRGPKPQPKAFGKKGSRVSAKNIKVEVNESAKQFWAKRLKKRS